MAAVVVVGAEDGCNSASGVHSILLFIKRRLEYILVWGGLIAMFLLRFDFRKARRACKFSRDPSACEDARAALSMDRLQLK